MRNTFVNKFLLICTLFFIQISFSCINRNNTNISIHEARDSYQFYATYNKNKTEQVQEYMNEKLRPNGFFTSESDYFDKTASLKDGTSFYVKSSPGKIKIILDKRDNSKSSYERVKHICDGLKEVLK